MLKAGRLDWDGRFSAFGGLEHKMNSEMGNKVTEWKGGRIK